MLVSGLDAKVVEAAAYTLAQVARSVPLADPSSEGLTVLGPAPAPIARIRDRYRWQLLLQGDPSTIREVGREIQRQARTVVRAVRVRVDPFPLQML